VDVVSFGLPPAPADTASYLRDLEQNCAKTTPKEVRAALLRAAQELEDWQRLGLDTANQLDEAANVRIGQMDSHSRVDEIQRGVLATMRDLAARFRELA
jgi:hypothetical protein